MLHGYPYDEVRPLSCNARRYDARERGNLDDSLGGFALTLIDSLDTLALTGDLPAFRCGVSRVVHDVRFDRDLTVSVFESSIRVLGGLISAHLLSTDPDLAIWTHACDNGDCSRSCYSPSGPGLDCSGVHCLPSYDGQLLSMAHELGTRLLPAFDTPSGMPYHRINLATGRVDPTSRESCTAAAGTYLLEFGILSRLTGDPVFEAVSRRANGALWARRSELGLIGSAIDVIDGAWRTGHSGIGGGIDSWVEYLAKSAVALDDDELMSMYEATAEAIKSQLVHEGVHLEVGMADGRRRPQPPGVSALQAFYPGLEAFTGSVADARTHYKPLVSLWHKYNALPEHYEVLSDTVGAYGRDAPLRPELIESGYHLFTATGDPAFVIQSAAHLQALNNDSRVSCGYASVADVTGAGAVNGRRYRLDDRMDSYFIAETAKYLFLTFDHALWHWHDGPSLGPSWRPCDDSNFCYQGQTNSSISGSSTDPVGGSSRGSDRRPPCFDGLALAYAGLKAGKIGAAGGSTAASSGAVTRSNGGDGGSDDREFNGAEDEVVDEQFVDADDDEPIRRRELPAAPAFAAPPAVSSASSSASPSAATVRSIKHFHSSLSSMYPRAHPLAYLRYDAANMTGTSDAIASLPVPQERLLFTTEGHAVVLGGWQPVPLRPPGLPAHRGTERHSESNGDIAAPARGSRPAGSTATVASSGSGDSDSFTSANLLKKKGRRKGKAGGEAKREKKNQKTGTFSSQGGADGGASSPHQKPPHQPKRVIQPPEHMLDSSAGTCPRLAQSDHAAPPPPPGRFTVDLVTMLSLHQADADAKRRNYLLAARNSSGLSGDQKRVPGQGMCTVAKLRPAMEFALNPPQPRQELAPGSGRQRQKRTIRSPPAAAAAGRTPDSKEVVPVTATTQVCTDPAAAVDQQQPSGDDLQFAVVDQHALAAAGAEATSDRCSSGEQATPALPPAPLDYHPHPASALFSSPSSTSGLLALSIPSHLAAMVADDGDDAAMWLDPTAPYPLPPSSDLIQPAIASLFPSETSPALKQAYSSAMTALHQPPGIQLQFGDGNAGDGSGGGGGLLGGFQSMMAAFKSMMGGGGDANGNGDDPGTASVQYGGGGQQQQRPQPVTMLHGGNGGQPIQFTLPPGFTPGHTTVLVAVTKPEKAEAADDATSGDADPASGSGPTDAKSTRGSTFTVGNWTGKAIFEASFVQAALDDMPWLSHLVTHIIVVCDTLRNACNAMSSLSGRAPALVVSVQGLGTGPLHPVHALSSDATAWAEAVEGAMHDGRGTGSRNASWAAGAGSNHESCQAEAAQDSHPPPPHMHYHHHPTTTLRLSGASAQFGPLLSTIGIHDHLPALASPMLACAPVALQRSPAWPPSPSTRGEQQHHPTDGMHSNSISGGGDAEARVVAVVARGGCTFASKARFAQAAGAHAVIIVDFGQDSDEAEGQAAGTTQAVPSDFVMADDGTGHDISIPAAFIPPQHANDFVRSLGIAGHGSACVDALCTAASMRKLDLSQPHPLMAVRPTRICVHGVPLQPQQRQHQQEGDAPSDASSGLRLVSVDPVAAAGWPPTTPHVSTLVGHVLQHAMERQQQRARQGNPPQQVQEQSCPSTSDVSEGGSPSPAAACSDRQSTSGPGEHGEANAHEPAAHGSSGFRVVDPFDRPAARGQW